METLITSLTTAGIGFIMMLVAYFFGNKKGSWGQNTFTWGIIFFFGGLFVAAVSLVFIGVG
jgi:uncharacterized membrane-anchored protein